jgi:hypothetical protein
MIRELRVEGLNVFLKNWYDVQVTSVSEDFSKY